MARTHEIYDPIRDKWVEATPEEKVRQKWIEVMIRHLKFPKNLIAVEKKILVSSSVRRLDLLVHYLNKSEELCPLLLIECKASPLDNKALLQLSGYQMTTKAPYFALANEDAIKVGYLAEGGYKELSFLPDYEQLTSAIFSKAVIAPHIF